MQEINQLNFGNPNNKVKKALLEESFLDNVFYAFQNHSYPENNSDAAKSELNEIVKSLEVISKEENAGILNNYLLFDRNVGQAIVQYFKKENIDVVDIVNNVIADVLPVVCKLKFFYGRIRPNQLAYYHKLKLFPYESKTSESPSYPCEKVVFGNIILSVLKEKYPEKEEDCNKFIETIQFSRVYLGLNYQSDIDFAIEIADYILKQPKIIAKYNL